MISVCAWSRNSRTSRLRPPSRNERNPSSRSGKVDDTWSGGIGGGRGRRRGSHHWARSSRRRRVSKFWQRRTATGPWSTGSRRTHPQTSRPRPIAGWLCNTAPWCPRESKGGSPYDPSRCWCCPLAPRNRLADPPESRRPPVTHTR